MKLQTALIINSLASLLMIIVWVPLSNVARENFNSALTDQIDAKEILQNFIELNEASTSLNINSTEEDLKLWERKYDIASIRLIPQYFTGSSEELILQTIQLRFTNLRGYYDQFKTIIQGRVSNPPSQLLAEETLTQLHKTSKEILDEVLLYTDLKQNALVSSSDLIDVYRSSTIIGAFLVITLINFLIYRSISLPIRKLTQVSEKISQGDFRMRLESADLPKFGEFGQLSQAFITMTSQLEELYSNLEDKVTKKTQALTETLEDIEEEKEKFEAQVLETEKFKQAVDSSTDGILIVAVNGDIVYSNNSWLIITGYEPRELIGKNIKAMQHLNGGQEIYQKIWQGIVGVDEVTIVEVINRRKSGETYQAQLAIYPIEEDGNPKYYVCVQQDITRRKEIDKAKTEFVSLASHQLRTPLSTIGWYTEMLMEGDAGVLNQEQTKLLKEIGEGNKRMVNLVNALLNVSRIELGTLSIDTKWVSIIDLSESVLNELRHQIETKKHQVTTDYDSRIPNIKTDPNLMRVLFQNLLSNSIKYTPDGGQIMVSIKADTPPGSKAEVKNIKITISDNGMGIPGRQQDQLFTKLFRADNVKETDTEGTGLGLYLVKSIVDYANGKIEFKSKENEGTTFIITLPTSGMIDKDGSKELISELPKSSTSSIKPI